MNAAFCELTGYAEPELLTRTFHDITHPDDLEAELAQVGRLLSGETGAFQVEKRYLRKDGEVVWIRVNSSLVRDEHGAPLHFIGQVEDITVRKAAEGALREALAAAQDANRAKGDFLDMMSHELRTPLQAVGGYSEFLLSAPEDSLTDEQREDIVAIHQASGRMITLINQLLDLSRMDARRLELAVEPVDLLQVIEAVRQDVAPQAAAKDLVLEIDLPPALPVVLGDAERVRQILLNLASNAVKFTDAGAVHITATPMSSGGVEVAVIDTGVGIPAEALRHIFEPFRQVGDSLTRQYGGSGLGLAIAWKLAQQMGGTITVSSEPGVGSTFRLHLPGEA